MSRRLRNSLPALVVVLLLAVALFAPSARVTARPAPVNADAYYPGCVAIASGGGGSSYSMALNTSIGICQPFGDVGNIASCSLLVQPLNFTSKRLELVSWDPEALAPDPTTIRLRTQSFHATWLAVNASRFDLLPPVITRAYPGVAEAPRRTTAFEYRVTYGGDEFATFQPEDASQGPSALWISPSGVRQLLPGSHPVLTHVVCGGDNALQSLYVAQSVMTTSTPLSSTNFEYVQKFRVPITTSLSWIEFALGPATPAGPWKYGRVRIVDAAGQGNPPVSFGPALADAQFFQPIYDHSYQSWRSHFDFATFPVLEPNHDYWLVLTTDHSYSPYAKALNGTESPQFQERIGPLFARAASGSVAELLENRALAFQLIGLPVGLVGVELPSPARGRLALEVSPNPSSGVAVISWSGESPVAGLEVMDARGRRVARGLPPPASSGRWAFDGRSDDGRALPAGIYFVGARDAAGRTATARLTLVR